MKVFKSVRQKIDERRKREQLYEFVVEEIEQNNIRPGLWGQALTEAGGNEERAKANYISLRVQALIDEMHLAGEAEQERLEQEERIRQRQLAIEKAKAQADFDKKFWFWVPLSVMVMSLGAYNYIEPEERNYLAVAFVAAIFVAWNMSEKLWLTIVLFPTSALSAYFGTMFFVHENSDPINILLCLLALMLSIWIFSRLRKVSREK